MAYRESAVKICSVDQGAPFPLLEFGSDLVGPSQSKYSMLFCGIGDARHLFVTLDNIGQMLASDSSILWKRFIITLVDINPAVFARDLLVFRMLADCVKEAGDTKRVTLVTISYVFGLQFMPPWANERLQTAIKDLLPEFEDQKADILGRFGVDGQTRKRISAHLRNWTKVPEGWYSTASILASTRYQNRNLHVKDAPGLVNDSVDRPHPQHCPGCETGSPEVLEYEELGVLIPSDSFTDLLEKFEPQLLEIILEWRQSRGPDSRHRLDQYLETYWKPNMTLINFDWELSRKEPWLMLAFLPHQLVSGLFLGVPTGDVVEQGTKGVLAHLVGFFDLIAKRYQVIKTLIWFEVIVDDMTAFMERIEHGILDRKGRFVSIQSSFLPCQYDRVHVSNVPDYLCVGGPLTTFVHGLPLLRLDKESYMTSRVLRNMGQWTTLSGFLCEYLLLDDRQKVQDTFAMALKEESAGQESSFDGKDFDGGGLVMAQPFRWIRTSTEPLEWHSMMPRHELEQWVYAHFLKLCLPAPRPESGLKLVYSPLNLSFVFRLVAHLHRRGYPAHWLSGILSALSTGKITTRARAPHSMVTDAEALEVRRVNPRREMSIGPFVAEFRTLLAVWRRLLPFGTLVADENVMPSLKAIDEYKMSFTRCDGLYKLRGTTSYVGFLLVFWQKNLLSAPLQRDLRRVLLDDEDSACPHSELYSAPDSSGFPIHVLSAWRWKSDDSSATFWLSRSVVENMLAQPGGWEATIYRSDSWTAVLEPQPVSREALTKGNSWC